MSCQNEVVCRQFDLTTAIGQPAHSRLVPSNLTKHIVWLHPPQVACARHAGQEQGKAIGVPKSGGTVVVWFKSLSD